MIKSVICRKQKFTRETLANYGLFLHLKLRRFSKLEMFFVPAPNLGSCVNKVVGILDENEGLEDLMIALKMVKQGMVYFKANRLLAKQISY